ncbi:hypothetical protein G9A89_013176 [Geosiphon pyriformis]|nr:hypothetical protein G9A89_013176 [Geosiphon pyriformis]
MQSLREIYSLADWDIEKFIVNQNEYFTEHWSERNIEIGNPLYNLVLHLRLISLKATHQTFVYSSYPTILEVGQLSETSPSSSLDPNPYNLDNNDLKEAILAVENMFVLPDWCLLNPGRISVKEKKIAGWVHEEESERDIKNILDDFWKFVEDRWNIVIFKDENGIENKPKKQQKPKIVHEVDDESEDYQENLKVKAEFVDDKDLMIDRSRYTILAGITHFEKKLKSYYIKNEKSAALAESIQPRIGTQLRS